MNPAIRNLDVLVKISALSGKAAPMISRPRRAVLNAQSGEERGMNRRRTIHLKLGKKRVSSIASIDSAMNEIPVAQSMN
jgi:hypothetical protein